MQNTLRRWLSVRWRSSFPLHSFNDLPVSTVDSVGSGGDTGWASTCSHPHRRRRRRWSAPRPGDSCTGALGTSSVTSTVKSLQQVFRTSSTRAPDAGVELRFLMPRRAAAQAATAHTSGPQHYRVNIFRKSATLPAWLWECWYCRCCRCTCCCCAWGTCCVCCGCWMYPTVLCCGTLVCRNVDVVPPCTSPWFIWRQKKIEKIWKYSWSH